MVKLVALAARLAVLAVTTGTTVATCTDALLSPPTVTDADKVPPTRPLKLVTVSCVVVALVTVP